MVAYFGADEDEDGVPDEPSHWTIEASAGSGGGIDPEGDVFVPDGGDQRFDFDPDRGYEIDRVRVDGDSERVRSSYTFEEVTENHTIRVTFTETDEGGDDDDDDDDGGITYLTITATAGEGGSISPDGRVQVAYDRNKSFIIQADEGYELADVLVDGRSVGAVGRYTFEKVHKNHTITAVFTASQKLNGVDRWLNTRDHIAYLSGYPDGTFGPDRNMTRAEVAQMFYALLNDQNVPATVSFSDVPDGAWYADAVETLASLGMFTGYPDGTFHPNSTITRAEFAAAALSFADMAPSARCSFPDVSAQDWFYPYVASAASTAGSAATPTAPSRPSGSITRAEVAVIVNHMLGRTPDQSFVDRSLDRLVSFSDLNSSHWAFYPHHGGFKQPRPHQGRRLRAVDRHQQLIPASLCPVEKGPVGTTSRAHGAFVFYALLSSRHIYIGRPAAHGGGPFEEEVSSTGHPRPKNSRAPETHITENHGESQGLGGADPLGSVPAQTPVPPPRRSWRSRTLRHTGG